LFFTTVFLKICGELDPSYIFFTVAVLMKKESIILWPVSHQEARGVWLNIVQARLCIKSVSLFHLWPSSS